MRKNGARRLSRAVPNARKLREPIAPVAYGSMASLASMRFVKEPAQVRIALVAPLIESVPPRPYGGTERVVSLLTEELARCGIVSPKCNATVAPRSNYLYCSTACKVA